MKIISGIIVLLLALPLAAQAGPLGQSWDLGGLDDLDSVQVPDPIVPEPDPFAVPDLGLSRIAPDLVTGHQGEDDTGYLWLPSDGGGVLDTRPYGGEEDPQRADPVPEPSTLVLLGAGLAVLGGRALRRRR